MASFEALLGARAPIAVHAFVALSAVLLGGVAASMTVIGFTGGGHCGPAHGEGLLKAGAKAIAGDVIELASHLLT
jgi:hypothetical protein